MASPTTARNTPDTVALAAALRRAVGEAARLDPGSRALYATDGSNYRQVPIGVVVPRSVDDVVATIAVAREHGAPVLPRGAGTSLAGQSCNVAVVIDGSKHLRRIIELDPERGWAKVEPGVIRDDLDRAAEVHGFTFAPDTATHRVATVGGMVGNNSCGVHSIRGGKTEDNVLALDVVTYDGLRVTVGPGGLRSGAGGRSGAIEAALRSLAERHGSSIRQGYPELPRRVSGYNLPRLLPEHGFDLAKALVGAEGTCVTVVGATVRLLPRPGAVVLAVLAYPDVAAAADDVPFVLDHDPIGLEGIDDVLVDSLRRKGVGPDPTALVPEGRGWLLVEMAGETDAEARAAVDRLARALRRRGHAPAVRAYPPEDAARVWAIREGALGATARVPGRPDTWEGWEDAAVPPTSLGAYLRDFRALLDRHGLGGALYGHFGQGCVHTRTSFDLRSPSGVGKYRAFVEAAADLVVSYGGSLSGEHGDGQSRAELLPRMFGPELIEAFRSFKAAWDPEGGMNPGKVVDPLPLDADLRLRTGSPRQEPRTAFAFPLDDGRFSRATERCIGVGACRKETSGVMCPSYMATGEERHSTRGRAHLLFEMLHGDPVEDGWRSEAVREALDLCLSCKACRAECPVQVDMATYKAEFLWHHYRGRVRPRAAYAMGLIHWWARLGSTAPHIATSLLRRAPMSGWVKRAGGIAPAREIPALAPTTFRHWFDRRVSDGTGIQGLGRPMLLWPDTFTDRFDPQRGVAAVEVLEASGHPVRIPPTVLCCGRPLYDVGMLTLARRVLRRTVGALRPAIRAGVPVVGIEPSCVAVFRDELPNLLPADPDAHRLSRQTLFLGEFLAGEGWRPAGPPPPWSTALVQPHCHQRAVGGDDPTAAMLAAPGVDVRVLDAGCCGMAGSFGFDARTYEVSQAIGEHRLFPALRSAPDAVVVADGFSCRTQIEQATGRRAMHLAEALRAGPDSFPSSSPRVVNAT